MDTSRKEILHAFKKEWKGRPWELLACQPRLHASDCGRDPSRCHAKAHGGQGGDSRQTAWLYWGQFQPDQPSGLL